MKDSNIPLRTQSIIGLPVLRPSQVVNPIQSKLSLIDKDGEEFYYDDPIQESLTCLELVCTSNFGKEDYYWNALYSPFPGTPLVNYAVAAGFADDDTDAHAYQFTTDSAVGNYGEVFDENIGESTPIGLQRGLNAQYKDGGLMYSPPFR